jgi:hypothetical protein
LSKRIVRGHDVSSELRFKSQNMKEFSPVNFRRIVENPDMKSKKDYIDYSTTVNIKEND